nr:phospholipid carrier-dependent glycosyltransferase [Nanoarchaeota archaeon]
ILILMTTYALAKNIVFKDKRKSLLAVLLLLSFPMFVKHSVYVSKDAMFAFFSVATIYLLMKYLQSRNSPYLIFGLITLAFTTQIKHLGMPLTISVILGLLFMLYHKKLILCFKKKERIANIIQSKETKMLLIGILLFIIIVSPYYIRNTVVFKDPVYPYLTYLPPYLEGKNFVPFLFEANKMHIESSKFFYSPIYTLFGVVNFVRDKYYSMSVFFLILLIFTLFGFKKMKKEQKYLLYFSIFYTIYYVYAFLLKYRYYMAIVPLLCVVVAGKFDNLLRFKLGKKEKRFFLISLIIILLILITYFVVLLNKESIIGILGFRAEHFLSSVDVVILMHLLVPIIALFFLLAIKNIKVKAVLLILVLLLPSLYLLGYVRWGVIKDTSGTLDQSKDLELFWREVLKPNPSKEAVLRLNLGNYYDAILFLNKNTPENAKIVSYNARSYYLERPIIPIESYKMEKTYTTNLTETLKLLKELNITHVLYKKPGWDEAVFRKDTLRSKSFITKNLNNTEIFQSIYSNEEYTLYKIEGLQ